MVVFMKEQEQRVCGEGCTWAATTITRVRNSLVGEYLVRGIVLNSRIVRKDGERLGLDKEMKREMEI